MFTWECQDTVVQQKPERPNLLCQYFSGPGELQCQEFKKNAESIKLIRYSQEIHQMILIKYAKLTFSSKLQNQMSQHLYLLYIYDYK